MPENLELFPIDAYTDRSPYFNDTSTKTKRPLKRALSRKDEAPKTSTNPINQGT